MSTAESIINHGNKLFADRSGLLAHWQDLAEHFYYERATFTATANTGKDFAAGSMTSGPAIGRREMGNLFRAMLRPQEFFKVKVDGFGEEGPGRDYLDWMGKTMRLAMYRKGGNFVRTTVETDHDYVTFGNGVIEVCPTPMRNGIYFKNYHLKDVAWGTDYAGNVESVHRDCKPTASTLASIFGKAKLPDDVKRMVEKEPYATVKARHVVAPRELYDIKATGNHPYLSCWVLPEHSAILESISRPFRGYVVPRADLVSGSQYARSPFTSIILPDARTKQSVERVLLEAGEKAVDPPMVAVKEAIRGDMGLYAGGITFVDEEYDERLGAALRPINSDRSGLPFGMELSAAYDRIIAEGLMLNKINLPADMGKMTAFEVRKRMEEHMRSHIPMFEPVEPEYNEPLVSETFEVMNQLGAFPASEMPDDLKGSDIEFEFKSPVKDMENENKPQMMLEGLNVLKAAGEFDPSLAQLPDLEKMTKDSLRAVGWPEDWLKDDEAFAQVKEAMAQGAQKQGEQEQIDQSIDTMGRAGAAMNQLAQVG